MFHRKEASVLIFPSGSASVIQVAMGRKKRKKTSTGATKAGGRSDRRGIEIIPFQYITHGGTVLNRKRGIHIDDRDRQACTVAAYLFLRKYAGLAFSCLMSAQRG